MNILQYEQKQQDLGSLKHLYCVWTYVLHFNVCAKQALNTPIMMYHACHVTTPLSQNW